MIVRNLQQTSGLLIDYIDSNLNDNHEIIITSKKLITNVKVIIKNLDDRYLYTAEEIQFNPTDCYNWFKPQDTIYYISGFKLEIHDENDVILYKTIFESISDKKTTEYLFNRISRIDDLYDDLEEVGYLKNIGYCDSSNNYNVIGYCYVHKWARILKIIKYFILLKKNIKFLEIGGGLSPIQFILANHGCKVSNLDINFTYSWFPIIGKYYLNATNKFIEESDQNISNIYFIEGNIYETIKNINSHSIDCVIDTCSLHTMIGVYDNNMYTGNIRNESDDAEFINEISRVLKPGGYFISVGDIANPHLGNYNSLFKYPNNMAKILNTNETLKLIEPYDYDTWEDELKTNDNFTKQKHVNFKDLSLINMKYKEPVGGIYLWVATYILKKQ